MSEQAKRRLHLIYSCVLGALLLTVGILFIVSCIGIYNSGDRPFTRESVSAAFSKIAVPVYITLLGAVGGIIIKIFLPLNPKKKNKAITSLTLKRLEERYPISECSPRLARIIKGERLTRRLTVAGGVLMLALSLIYPLIYIFTPNRFPADNANGEIADAVIMILIYLIPLTIYLVFAVFLTKNSMNYEIAKIKELKEPGVSKKGAKCTEEKKQPRALTFINSHKKIIFVCLKCLVLILGATFVILGVTNGGMNDVLQKAVRICTECIGLG